MKLKKMQFLGKFKPKMKPNGINGNPLYIYLKYKLETIITNSARQIVSTISIFLEANKKGFDIILGRLWLKETKLFIN